MTYYHASYLVVWLHLTLNPGVVALKPSSFSHSKISLSRGKIAHQPPIQNQPVEFHETIRDGPSMIVPRGKSKEEKLAGVKRSKEGVIVNSAGASLSRSLLTNLIPT